MGTVAPMHRNLEFGVKHNKKPVPRLDVLSRCLYNYAKRWKSIIAPIHSLVSREAVPPLPDVL